MQTPPLFTSLRPSQVTNQVKPHPNLIFSIKHVALDFWRYVKFNPCLAQGQHRQVRWRAVSHSLAQATSTSPCALASSSLLLLFHGADCRG